MGEMLSGVFFAIYGAEKLRVFWRGGNGSLQATNRWDHLEAVEMIAFFQWLFLVPLKGGRWHIIPLIYCQLGGYMLPTTNQKQPLMFWY